MRCILLSEWPSMSQKYSSEDSSAVHPAVRMAFYDSKIQQSGQQCGTNVITNKNLTLE